MRKHPSSSFPMLIFRPTPPHLLVSTSLVFTVGYTQPVPISSVRQQAAREVIGQHTTVSFGCSLHLAFPPLLLASYCSTAPTHVLHSLQSLDVYLPWHRFSLGNSPSGVSLSWYGSSTGRRSSRCPCLAMGHSPSRVPSPAQSMSFQENNSSHVPK